MEEQNETFVWEIVTFERVQEFKYLGSLLTDTNKMGRDITEKIQSGDKTLLNRLIGSKILSKRMK